MYRGSQELFVSGAVDNAYTFPDRELNLETVEREMDYRGTMTVYKGYLLADIVDFAQPVPQGDTLLLEASDGYAFLLSFEELETNPNILLVQSGQGKNASFDVVGPKSSKAWVRNVEILTIITGGSLEIRALDGQVGLFDPDEWTAEMDSTQVSLPSGSQKLQGVPVWKIIESSQGNETINQIIIRSAEGEIKFEWQDIANNDDLRVFSVVGDENITFVLAEISGDVLLNDLTGIEIQ
jgi:hypothetical protein